MTWLRWKNNRPQLVLNERHDKQVKWAIRSLTAAGLLTSLIALPWFLGLPLALALLGIEIFLERTAYWYATLFLQPFPDFTYEPDKWTAMAYAVPKSPAPNAPPMVLLVFADEAYGRAFFGLLRAWNHDSIEDRQDNVRLTFITDEDAYYVYLYPNPDRPQIKAAFDAMEEDLRQEKHGKEAHRHVAQIIMCHAFDSVPAYMLGMFVDACAPGSHFRLIAATCSQGAPPVPIHDIDPIDKWHYKYKPAVELAKDEFEYSHWHLLVLKDRQPFQPPKHAPPGPSAWEVDL